MSESDSEIAQTRFSSIVSCKWLVIIGFLSILLSLVIGIILGVMAVHLSSAFKSATSVEDHFMSASIMKQSTQPTINSPATTETPSPTRIPITFTTSKGKFVNRDLTSVSFRPTESTTLSLDHTIQLHTAAEVNILTKQNISSFIPATEEPTNIQKLQATDFNTEEPPVPSTKEPQTEDPNGEVSLSTEELASSNHDDEIVPKVMPTLPPKSSPSTTHDPMIMATRPQYLLPQFALDNLQHVLLTVQPNVSHSSEPVAFSGSTNAIAGYDAVTADTGVEATDTDHTDANDTNTTDTGNLDETASAVEADASSTDVDMNADDVIDLSGMDKTDMDDSFRHPPELVMDSETVNSANGMMLCPGTNKSISVDQICDGTIHCPDATDELNCCRKNLDPAMICDGVFDCPSLEDEVGCAKGCDKSQFECRDVDRTCIPLPQRCDSEDQCPNGRDEIGCHILSPDQKPPQVPVPAYSAGFVVRNVRNSWTPLCFTEGNITELINDICYYNVGHLSGDIHVKAVQARPDIYNGTYIDYNPDGNQTFKLVNRCPSSKLMFISCFLQCGRQVSTATANRKTLQPSATVDSDRNSGDSTTPSLQLQSRISSLSSDSAEPKQLTSRLRSRKYRSPCRIKSETRTRSRVHRQRRRALDRIVGGRSSSQGQWPWTVAVLRDGAFICGGALLSSQWILVASHCFNNYDRYYYEIRVGMLRQSALSPFEQTRVITAVIQHPEYNSDSISNDVAMVFIDEPLHLNQWVNPICLPPEDYSPPVGSFCTVTGWGDVYEGGILSNSLRDVAVPITQCPASSIIPNSTLCAGYPEGKKDACQGDSGSPLVCQNTEHPDHWVLAGIVSYGTGCARPNQPGVYSRATYYLPFINRVMGSGDLPELRPNVTCRGISCRAKAGGSCVQLEQICDGEIHCYDAQDEMNCIVEDIIYPEKESNSDESSSIEDVTSIEEGSGAENVSSTEDTSSTEDISSIEFASSTEVTIEVLPTEQAPNFLVPTCPDNQFTCSKIFQCIPLEFKCDMHSDCQDETDESQCSCADYLDRFNQTLVNDGHVDCWDYSDEQDYWPCPAGQYYSQLTEECHDDVVVCDHLSQAPHSEDELNCLTLTSPQGKVVIDRTNRPVRRQSGVISWYKQKSWRSVCFEQVSPQMADQVCQYLGYTSSVSHRIVIGSTDPLPVAYPAKEILWGLADVNVSTSNRHATSEGSISRLFDPKSSTSDAEECQLANLTCSDQQCGIRPLYHNAEPRISEDLNTEAQWPWHVVLYRDGDFICGATLVSSRWLIISNECAQTFDLTVNYVAALMGSWRFTRWASPHEQIRRIVNSVEVEGSQIVMLLMETPANLDAYVNPICLPGPEKIAQLVDAGRCVVTGQHGSLPTSYVNFTDPTTCNSTSLCGSWGVSPPCSNDYSGTVVCSDGFSWFATAIMSTCSSSVETQDMLDGLWQHIDVINSISACGTRYLPKKSTRNIRSICSNASKTLPAPACSTHRCTLGRCLQAQDYCNGIPDCRDWSDETPECSKISRLCDGNDCDEVNECQGDNCPQYRCLSDNGTTVIRLKDVCNGINECSDGQDESQCVSLTPYFPMNVDSYRNPKVDETSGYLTMRLSGQWYTYCSNDWNQTKSDAFCKYRGFNHAKHQFKSSPLNSRSYMHSSCSSVVYISCS